MLNYLIRRLLLLPLTLLAILLVNFVIINLAPGDPTTVSEITQQGATRREDRSIAFGSDDRYLQFREFYGLTLPILFNSWPLTTEQEVLDTLNILLTRRFPHHHEEIPFKEYESIRISFGDRSRFIMPLLLKTASNSDQPEALRKMALRFFVRGGTHQAILGPGLTPEQKAYNKKVSEDNNQLATLLSNTDLIAAVEGMQTWYEKNKAYYHFEPTGSQKVEIFFFETRFSRYMSRVLRLDFGTLRNDSNKTVVSEVTRRFKYSLTLSILPMLMTVVACTIFGFIMAYYQHRLPDYGMNLLFLVLYAVPVFVVAPFLIEIALNHNFPFTETPIPTSGFTSSDAIYNRLTTWQKVIDVLQHITLPLIAVMYGGLAAQSRLSRTAVLEVLHQDYVRTAKAKGVAPLTIMYKHVGRNAAITIVTSIAGSLGIVLGGSLIVETLFDINGFGRFFYEAVVNRDYNVIMFSAIAGSFLTLMGYLIGDIAYTVLDPRVTLD